MEKDIFEEDKEGGNYQPKGIAQFSNFEVLDSNNDVFFGAYDPNKFRITKDNNERNNRDKNYGFPFNTPSEESNPGILMIKLNIDLFEQNVKYLLQQDSVIYLHK